MSNPVQSTSPVKADTKLSKAQVSIRPASEADIGFIFNSWLKSYKQSSFAKYVPNPVYFDHHHKAIELLLKRSKVLVACNPADNNQIYGYLVHETVQETSVVHYCYTKEAFRKMGILQLLLSEAKLPEAFFYSHSTVSGSFVIPKLKHNPVYNPYLAFTELKV